MLIIIPNSVCLFVVVDVPTLLAGNEGARVKSGGSHIANISCNLKDKLIRENTKLHYKLTLGFSYKSNSLQN